MNAQPDPVALCRQLHGPGSDIVRLIDSVCEEAAGCGADVRADLDLIRAACSRLATLISGIASASRPDLANSTVSLLAYDALRHELRTPLNAVKGYGDMLIEDWQQTGQDRLIRSLRAVLRLADQILAAIDAGSHDRPMDGCH